MKIFGITSKVFVALFWLIIWYLIYVLVNRDLFIPSPFAVIGKLYQLIFMASFWKSIAYSILRIFVGFILAMFVGVILGVMAGLNSLVRIILEPFITVIRVTPVMSFIILAIIWFNSNLTPVFICFLMCMPIIWTNVMHGVQQADENLLEMALLYQLTFYKRIRYIYMPTMWPNFVAGTVSALGLGWKAGVAAEILCHPRYGIGTNLYTAKIYIDTIEVFTWTITIIILSILFEKIITNIFNHRCYHYRKYDYRKYDHR